jgi:PilZ domain
MPHYSYATGFGSSDIDEPLSEPQIEADRRRHVRFEVNLLGRFMRADKNEYPCRAISISVGDAAFMSPVTVTTGERVVAYLDSIGGIEGVVTRVIDGGFAVKISATQHKREKLAAQITWLINRAELDGMEARRSGHERIASGNKTSILRLPNDEEFDVQLQDVSISGASVVLSDRPAIGTEVSLGKLRARVMRHHADGIGVQFLDIQNPEALRRSFG